MAVKVIQATKKIQKTTVGEENHKLRVAAYCRVSTDSEEQETSYEAQCRHYTDYIRKNPDWEMAGIYADEGISGTQAGKRPEFLHMIEDCEKGEIDFIITKSISRWARNTLDSLNYIRKLKDLGIPVLFEKENINTMDARGELLITIMSSIAQQESQSISQNVRMGIQYHMQQGRGWVNTTTFLGFGPGEKPGDLVIIPEEADLVRRIFRDFLEGYSPARIGRHLERDAIPTKAGSLRWHASTITNILENEKYAGDMLLQKYYTKDFLTHRLVKNRGELPQYFVEDHHPPIIPKEIYKQVQGELVRRGALKKEAVKLRFGSEEALTGRIICGRCGNVLKRYQKPENPEYLAWIQPCTDPVEWRCRTRAYNKKTRGRNTPSPCGCRFVPEEEAKKAVLYALNRLPEYRDALLRRLGELEKGEIRRIDALMVRSEETVKMIENRLEEIGSQGAEKTQEMHKIQGKRVHSPAVGATAPDKCPGTTDSMEYRGCAGDDAVGADADIADNKKAAPVSDIHDLSETSYLRKQFLREQENQEHLRLERAEYARQGIQVRLLLELTDSIREQREKVLPPRTDGETGIPGSCTDPEDFFRRTRYRLPEDIITEEGFLIRFEDSFIVRYLDHVTIFDEDYEIHLKAGITIRAKAVKEKKRRVFTLS